MKHNKAAADFRNDGNLEFRQKKFIDALISYNQSLCNAVPNSENLSLAYANRSAVYLELKQFDKCIENIQLARAHGYKNEAKLKEREERCEKLKETHQADPENDPANFFKLTYPQSEKHPPFADCLEIKENKKWGRHIITNRDLSPGDIIAIEEPSLKNVFHLGCFTRCNFCLKSNGLSLIPCDQICTRGKFNSMSFTI
jgi:SET and MYND domain-containing protein 4